MDELCPSCVSFWALTKTFWGAGFGAFVLYVLNRLNGHTPFSVLTAMGANMNTPFKIFGDMLLSSGIGAVIVLVIVSPQTASDATLAGLGLTGILSAFGKKA